MKRMHSYLEDSYVEDAKKSKKEESTINQNIVLQCSDLMSNICQFLDLRTVKILSSTCKYYKELINSPISYHTITPEFFEEKKENIPVPMIVDEDKDDDDDDDEETEEDYYYKRLKNMLNNKPELLKNIKNIYISLESDKYYEIIRKIFKISSKIKNLDLSGSDNAESIKGELEFIIKNYIKELDSLKLLFFDIVFINNFMTKNPDFKNTSIKDLSLRSFHNSFINNIPLADSIPENYGKFIGSFKNIQKLHIENITIKHLEFIIPLISSELKELSIEIVHKEFQTDPDVRMFNICFELIKVHQKKLEKLTLNILPYVDTLTFKKGDFPELKELNLDMCCTCYLNSPNEKARLVQFSVITDETIQNIIDHLPKLKKIFVNCGYIHFFDFDVQIVNGRAIVIGNKYETVNVSKIIMTKFIESGKVLVKKNNMEYEGEYI